jgi:chromate transporter
LWSEQGRSETKGFVLLTTPESDSADAQELLQDRGATKIPAISLWRLLWIWIGVGAQSFGGGSATLYLIRRVAVERYHWISDEEFARYWGICQIAPGINILGLVILIGWRVAGAIGVAMALGGLLLPSAAITVALTAVYSSIKQASIVRAALSGVVPATVGLGLLLAYTMVRPLFNAARKEGRGSAAVSGALLVGSTLFTALLHAPVLAILWGAGALSALAQWQRAARQRQPR